MSWSTAHRVFILGTPLGDDELLITEFEGSERLSQPFRFELTMRSGRDDIAPDELVGRRVTLGIETADDERRWTGTVSAFTRLATDRFAGSPRDTMTTYRCEVVPWIRMLLLHEDSRIFQNLSIPGIVAQIFEEFRFTDYELQLNGRYERLEHCTQYRESTFAFIARLLERAGIWYWFRPEVGSEKLILTDHIDGCPDLDPPSIRFDLQGSWQEGDTISAFERHERIRSGGIVMRSYDFTRPAADLETRVDSLVRIGGNSSFERFVHPGGYVERDAGEAIARLLMEAEEAEHATMHGRSNARLLTPGYCFELLEHPHDELNRKYLIVSVEHRGRNNIDGDSGSSYENTFSAIPHDVPYRALPVTPKPRIAGIQTAMVTGPAGEEIYTDEYGRVKVHMLWDRWGSADDKASCWVRVMQAWSGNGWGAFVLPRIGMEVVVGFENGDPDHPLVIGCVYNGANRPPYPLPAQATRSTFKTSSSKGGDGFNELRFEDRKGGEEIFLHAERDLQVRVKADSRDTVGGNRETVILGHRATTIGDMDSKDAATMFDDVLVTSHSRQAYICQNDELSVTTDWIAKAGRDISLNADNALLLASTNFTFVFSEAEISIDALRTISLNVGPSSITLSPAGVTIDGPLVRLNCGGTPLPPGAPLSPEEPAEAAQAALGAAGSKVDPMQQVQAQALRAAAAAAQPFCAACEAARAALAAMGAL